MHSDRASGDTQADERGHDRDTRRHDVTDGAAVTARIVVLGRCCLTLVRVVGRDRRSAVKSGCGGAGVETVHEQERAGQEWQHH